MSARADDMIRVFAAQAWGSVTSAGPLPASAHVCVGLHQSPRVERRDSLDPMALGLCRYCGEPLPTPRTGGGSLTTGERRSN